MGWRVPKPALAALALALLVAAPAADAARKPTRYSVAGGCYALRSASGGAVAGAERLRMQATDLGSYLLYRPDATFLAAQDDDTVTPADQPSPAADWRLADAGARTFTLSPASQPDHFLSLGADGRLTVVTAGAAGQTARFGFTPAKGCAVYPEASLDAHGRPARGKTSYGAVQGFVDGHQHWMTFEFLGGNFHCGRPWHPYGIAYALPDCSGIEGPQGSGAPVQNFLNYGQPASPHDTTGWPKFTSWGPDNLTYEGTYWRWVERAWLSGLRLIVLPAVENRELCQLEETRRNSCDEMESVRKEIQDTRELQRYVDAQAGGPGKGFFQIVTSPDQARRVINRGKMAVVLEIEVSELFGCHNLAAPTCDRAQIDRQLDEVYRLGVRSSLLLNKFDNPLSGVRFDGGAAGTIINVGNRDSAGSFWSAETCKGRLHDNTIETYQPGASSGLDSLFGQLGVSGGAFPTYPPAPHCNTRGLTDLGRYVERRMMDRHMIINPDHMSQKAVDDTLTLAESRHYSGLISPHGWMDPGNWPRIWKLGGVAWPGHSLATNYIKDWRKYRPRRTPYLLGWGYGADMGGISGQPEARPGSIHYPFKSYDGRVTFDRQRTGERTFDYTKDGVAQYGLYADWFEDLRRLGGRPFVRDMSNGAEAYLEMWERASGIRAPGCRGHLGHFNSGGLVGIRLGARWEALLRRAGQPQQRTRAWSWCVRGKGNRRAADVAELTPSGRVELVGTTARGRPAGGVFVGTSARVLRARARSIGGGLFIRRAVGGSYVYVIRRGRVAVVGVATRRLARRHALLRAAVRRLRRARASNVPRRFVPNPTAGSTRLTGRTLAGTGDPRLDRAAVFYCPLNL